MYSFEDVCVPVSPKDEYIACDMCEMPEYSLVDIDAFEGDQEQGIVHGGDEPQRIPGDNSDLRALRKLMDPRLPSVEEVEQHNLTHLPYRNWCPICIKAKGKDLDHRVAVDKERGISEYCFDYCFPGDELGFKWTVLVGTEKGADCAMATLVPVKGGGKEFSD